MKWFLEITTAKGRFEIPFNGYKTKKEAEAQKELADREPQNLTVKIIKK